MLFLCNAYYVILFFCFFFFKQKTAYEMRISDWSSDVCSSDLWLSSLRQSALARFTAMGLPTPRQESWKYTSLRPLEKLGFGATGAPRACISIDRAPSLLPAASEHHRLVFVDGHPRADLSSVGRLPEGPELDRQSVG